MTHEAVSNIYDATLSDGVTPAWYGEVAAHDDAELNDVISEELGALTARYLGVVNKGSIRTFQISANNKIDIGLLDLGK